MPTRPLAAAVAILLSGAAQAAPSFVNGLALDGAMLDLSGGSDANNGRVGFFSDIYYDSQRNEWWGLSDRGPGGGTLDYATRVQRFTLDIDAATGAIGNFQIAETVIFKSAGAPLNGIAPSPASNIGLAFDPEGLVVNPKTGTFLVSDEYGPSVREFSRSGELLRTYTTPDNLVPRDAAGTPNFASDAGNSAGKRTNRGFEGLAISPDGKYAFAMLQSAMLDEGGGNGSINRIVKFDTATGQAVGQYAYSMKRSGQGQGISALVAIGGGSLSVPFMTWCNVKVHNAIGTSAAIGLPIAVAGALGYLINGWSVAGLPEWSFGYVYLPALVLLSLLSSLTAPIGARLAHKLPVATLKKVFAGLLIALSAKMLHTVLGG